MAVVPFYQIVGQRASRETRSVTVPEGLALPAGSYAFIEFYCNDPKCDCRRVIFQVCREDTGGKIWATISYGWGTAEYYAKRCGWLKGAKAELMASAMLEPLSPQTELSAELLDMFTDVLLQDDDYVARLKRHYQQACPGRVSGEPGAVRAAGGSAAEKRRRRAERLRRR